MSKFNLKDYKKSDGDLHTDKMLQEQHVDAPQQISEKQLDEKRIDKEPDSVSEKQLDKVRADDEGRTIEGRLNQDKARFDIKHRNKDAYNGDINKVEEKRIASDKMEDEKYEVAADTNKELRWWETKTNDGLKLASTSKAMTKIAAGDEEEDVDELAPIKGVGPKEDAQRFRELGRMWGAMEEGVDDSDPGNEFIGEKEESDKDIEAELGSASKDLFVAKKNDPISIPGMPYAAFYSIGYDPDAWANPDELGQAVIDKVLELRPDLEGRISSDMLAPGKPIGNVSYMNLRLIGDMFSPDFREEAVEGVETAEDFVELDFGKTDVGGTPMIVGKIKINESINMDEEEVRSAIADFISDKHPEIKINADSIQIEPSGDTATFAIADAASETVDEAIETPIEQPAGETPETKMEPATPSEETFEIIDDTTPSPEPEEETFEIVDDTKKPIANSINKVVTAQKDTKKN